MPSVEKAQESNLASRNLGKSYFNGMIVGVVQAVVFHPVDVARVRWFLGKKELGSGRSLFNGLSFNIGSTALKQMAVFPTQEVLKEKMGGSEVWSGIGSGVVLGLIACPINAIKTPLGARRTPTTTLAVCQEIVRERGIMGFYRGGLALFLRDFFWASSYFPIYGWLRNRYRVDGCDHCGKVRDSIIAGAISMTVAYPFDGSRLYRQYHKGDKHTFWCGFKASFAPTASNLKSYLTGVIRTPLSITMGHMLYLYLRGEW